MSDVKILIVEDEIIVALEIQLRLISMGFKVCGIAPTGEKAILLAGTTSPDIVLMDIKLKGKMTGIEAAKAIKDAYSVPSIFITAFSNESVIEQIKTTLAFEYLLKPFQEADLVEAIERTLSAYPTSRS